MGYSVAAFENMSLISERSDLEYRAALIVDAKENLGRTATELLQVGTDLDPDSPVVKKLEQRKERLHLIEKKLDLQLERIKKRLSEIDIARQSAAQMMQKNIKESFSFCSN